MCGMPVVACVISTPPRRPPGLISRSNSKNLGVRYMSCWQLPVMLRPGRRRLSTSPMRTGSPPKLTNTSGTVRVARWKANTAFHPATTTTLGLEARTSRARASVAGIASPRKSTAAMSTSRPSTRPRSAYHFFSWSPIRAAV
jgi:hypothetical protein